MGFFKDLFSKSKPRSVISDVDYKKTWDELQTTVSPLAKPCLRLIKTTVKTNSQLGGKPRVNIDSFEWPYINGKPMAFIAQFDLAELMPVFQVDWLPTKGSLIFFYDIDDMVWGFDPKDKGHWKILYETNRLTEVDFPIDLDEDYRLQQSFVSPTCVSVLPGFERDEVTALHLTDEQFDAYIEYQDSDQSDQPKHQVGGFPSPVQGDGMELEAQLVTNGLYCGDPSGYQDPRAKELEAGAKDWRLLLQVDSDDELDIMWGDSGILYFWIREEDARELKFDKSWLILQCG